MTETNHDRWNEDIAAYALGALDPGEAAELERHVEGCERCRSELRWLTPAARSLPESVERREPPRELRRQADGGGPRRRRDLRGRRRERPSAAHFPGWFRRLRSGRLGLASRWPASPLSPWLAVAVPATRSAATAPAARPDQHRRRRQGPRGHREDGPAKGDGGTLHLANVDQLPDGRVLEAWVQRDGEVEAGAGAVRPRPRRPRLDHDRRHGAASRR